MKTPIILIISLFLTIAGNAIAGEKEYLLKKCKSKVDAQNCEKCEVEGKISFKVSKSLASVMLTVKLKDGRSGSSTIDNCKIFDDETFECETKEDAQDNEAVFDEGYETLNRLSNGKYISISHQGQVIDRPIPSLGWKGFVSPKWDSYQCATEIKSLLNWFK